MSIAVQRHGSQSECTRRGRTFAQISTGLGAGNIGDEIMSRALWASMPDDVHLQVDVLPYWRKYRGGYDHRYTYTELPDRNDPHAPGLLACGTPVSEIEGLGYPLRSVAARLRQFHDRGLPVYAIGVGVDRLYSRRAREIFDDAFAPIASWSVRTEQCRNALLEMGVPAARITVGADQAWLYRRRENKGPWAAELLASIGIDVNRPLLLVNVVNVLWRSATHVKPAIAAALDHLHQEHNLQIAFYCNECRGGDLYDRAAAEVVRGLMRAPSVIVPNEYWSCDEAIGILSHATVVLSQRYHTSLMAVLAGSLPATMTRSAKMHGLMSDLHDDSAIDIHRMNAGAIVAAVEGKMANRERLLPQLAARANELARRAERNLRILQNEALSVCSA